MKYIIVDGVRVNYRHVYAVPLTLPDNIYDFINDLISTRITTFRREDVYTLLSDGNCAESVMESFPLYISPAWFDDVVAKFGNTEKAVQGIEMLIQSCPIH